MPAGDEWKDAIFRGKKNDDAHEGWQKIFPFSREEISR
jgi:hypothetical protein